MLRLDPHLEEGPLMANHDVRDMEQRIRDERLQPADVHAQRGRAAARRLHKRPSTLEVDALFAARRKRGVR